MANSSQRRKIILFSLIGLGLAALVAVILYRKREPVVTVQTEQVTRRTLTEVVTANGKIQPVVQVNISPEVSGEIIELPLKEGQRVRKGELILKIKPDFYVASRNQAEASYKSALAGQASAEASLRKAEAEFKRNEDLYRDKLISGSAFDEVTANYDVARAQLQSAIHQVEVARASLASAEDALAKTTIVSPITGTVSKLNSEVGERVVGTATMAGTEVMTIADLNTMEARVDLGEMDVVVIAPGQHVRLDVDAFKDRKFTGTVTEIANSSKGSGLAAAAAATSQEATKFEVRIRVKENDALRPGMSVTAEIEARSRTNVLTVPIASVTTRLPKDKSAATDPQAAVAADPPGSNLTVLQGTNTAPEANDKKSRELAKPVEVVFIVEGGRAKMVPVKLGISDDSYWEITEGLKEGQEVVSGGFRAISRDLDDGKRIRKGVTGEKDVEPGEEK
jgi:HlyD family secretion protein